MLKPDGYLGFLTSSSWLDVEYGFHLQAWILQYFQLIAVMESNAEPWFPDARVKTCVAIMRRCSDAAMRMNTRVKFVQFKKPLAEIIAVPTGEGAERQRAADRLREEIESTTADRSDERMRIIVKPQSDLWEAGVRAGQIVGSAAVLVSAESTDEHSDSEIDLEEEEAEGEPIVAGSYVAGKWGRYVRAPDFYFAIMREFGARFAPLGELVTVRFGVKSGCDAFFMPRDISQDALDRFASQREFRREYGVDRDAVADGTLEAFQSMQERRAGPFVEQALLDCHSPERADRIARSPLVIPIEFGQEDRRRLDDAVFDLLGVDDEKRRTELINELYHETALHFRNVRVGEIHKVEQRRTSTNRHFSTDELSSDLWDAAELEDLTPLREWLAYQPIATAGAIIPEASPAYLSNHAKMFDNNTVYFGKDRKDYMVCKSREEAELIKLLADLGLHGAVNIPPTPEGSRELLEKVRERVGIASARFEELASTRTSLEDKRAEVVDLLLRWYVLGRPTTTPVIQ